MLSLAVFWLTIFTASAEEIRWHNERFAVQCDPARLALTLTPRAGEAMQFLPAWTNAVAISDFQQTSNRATWHLVAAQVTVTLQLETNGVRIEFTAEQPGVFEWPRFTPGTALRGWILPLFEGVYVASTNSAWRDELLSPDHLLDTTADFDLPFWGADFGDGTLTCLLLNPFNNTIQFDNDDGQMRLRFTHEFTRNNPVKQFGFCFVLGPESPVEPAREYRRWLQSRGEFVSLAEKIKHTPDAAKLLGAVHAYLWGDALLSVDDVKDWKGLARTLQTAGTQTNLTPAKQIWLALDAETQKAATEILKAEWPDRYHKSLLANGLDHWLTQTNFSQAEAAELSQADLCSRNVKFLTSTLGEFLQPPETWGEGISPQMIRELSAAGLDHLWLGAEGWAGLVKRPETVALARSLGYLIGTYDSYDSVHSPAAKSDATWPTAQFDEELFLHGGVIKADGEPARGFQKKGFRLNAQAARPWLERRVSGLMKIFPANSWFMDCDGFGDFYDDYSTNHPATQASDMAERIARCRWIRDTYQAVIGSEGCSAGLAATLFFAHGVLTPVIGWGDPDLKNKGSKYFLGAYYPSAQPAVFFKPVPLKEKYRRLFYDPAVRLPLFETVFHDSVVATHHWSNSSLKFPEVAGTVELLELLYNVPPLYHLNRSEFAKQKTVIKRHYDFFSPLHRELGQLPLTDFNWLTPDKLVQTTTFGGSVEVTANFGDMIFTNAQIQLPAQTVMVRWLDGSRGPLFYQAIPPSAQK
jgi:hypothetical protein